MKEAALKQTSNIKTGRRKRFNFKKGSAQDLPAADETREDDSAAVQNSRQLPVCHEAREDLYPHVTKPSTDGFECVEMLPLSAIIRMDDSRTIDLSTSRQLSFGSKEDPKPYEPTSVHETLPAGMRQVSELTAPNMLLDSDDQPLEVSGGNLTRVVSTLTGFTTGISKEQSTLTKAKEEMLLLETVPCKQPSSSSELHIIRPPGALLGSKISQSDSCSETKIAQGGVEKIESGFSTKETSSSIGQANEMVLEIKVSGSDKAEEKGVKEVGSLKSKGEETEATAPKTTVDSVTKEDEEAIPEAPPVVDCVTEENEAVIPETPHATTSTETFDENERNKCASEDRIEARNSDDDSSGKRGAIEKEVGLVASAEAKTTDSESPGSDGNQKPSDADEHLVVVEGREMISTLSRKETGSDAVSVAPGPDDFDVKEEDEVNIKTEMSRHDVENQNELVPNNKVSESEDSNVNNNNEKAAVLESPKNNRCQGFDDPCEWFKEFDVHSCVAPPSWSKTN